MSKVSVVVLNFNGADFLADCLDSLKKQSYKAEIIVVDNASVDESAELVSSRFTDVIWLQNDRNLGFAGGVNTGIEYAISSGCDYVALLNNDAKADKDWLKHLVETLNKQPRVGIATSKFLDYTGETIDSTGDIYTLWGLPYPRGRGEPAGKQYDKDTDVFGASGGSSLYRIRMLNEIGLFDRSLFAYFEDVDLSFRAQIYGWKVAYVPLSIAYHRIGATTSKVKGFATYHTIKNLPLLFWKNVPWGMMRKVWPRLLLAHWSIILRALSRGQIIPVFKGILVALLLWPKKLLERRRIQKNKRVTNHYLLSIIDPNLPPNARRLRRLSRSKS